MLDLCQFMVYVGDEKKLTVEAGPVLHPVSLLSCSEPMNVLIKLQSTISANWGMSWEDQFIDYQRWHDYTVQIPHVHLPAKWEWPLTQGLIHLATHRDLGSVYKSRIVWATWFLPLRRESGHGLSSLTRELSSISNLLQREKNSFLQWSLTRYKPLWRAGFMPSSWRPMQDELNGTSVEFCCYLILSS